MSVAFSMQSLESIKLLIQVNIQSYKIKGNISDNYFHDSMKKRLCMSLFVHEPSFIKRKKAIATIFQMA